MIELLHKMGLSQSEAKTYLALTQLGPSLAGTVAKKAQLNRTNCYDALNRLIGKGLVSHVIKSQRKYFRAEDPIHLISLIEWEKERLRIREIELKKLIPLLSAQVRTVREKPFVTLYHGKKGVKSIFEDVLDYKEYWVFGSSGKMKESLGPYFELFQKRVRKKKISVRLLAGERVRGTDISKHADTRFIPDEYTTIISTLVYGDKIAIISWTDEPAGFMIEDKQTAESYQKYFEFMWKIANK